MSESNKDDLKAKEVEQVSIYDILYPDRKVYSSEKNQNDEKETLSYAN